MRRKAEAARDAEIEARLAAEKKLAEFKTRGEEVHEEESRVASKTA